MPERRTELITVLSDFGECDWYVAAMKGVILARLPRCRLLDISHQIPPGDILAGAFVLLGAYKFFPPGTVHLAVVDPGVGGRRRAIVAEAGGYGFVGPDNGLLSLALAREPEARVRHVQREDLYLRPVSRTFHGRDIFAPLAAFLAGGGDSGSLGPEVEDWVRLQWAVPKYRRREAVGQVMYVDRFGNGITNFWGETLHERLGAGAEVFVGDRSLGPVRETYGNVRRGRILALVGSSGFLEIAVHGGSARVRLQLRVGTTPVVVRARDHGESKGRPRRVVRRS
jgi:S-adenosyl-L-methionine hydrolase (adenosine-forming)